MTDEAIIAALKEAGACRSVREVKAIRLLLADERERAAKIAESPYSDTVQALGQDEPLAVGAKIAAAIRGVTVFKTICPIIGCSARWHICQTCGYCPDHCFCGDDAAIRAREGEA